MNLLVQFHVDSGSCECAILTPARWPAPPSVLQDTERWEAKLWPQSSGWYLRSVRQRLRPSAAVCRGHKWRTIWSTGSTLWGWTASSATKSPQTWSTSTPRTVSKYLNPFIFFYFSSISSDTNATVWTDIIGEFVNTGEAAGGQRQELEDVEAGLTEALEAELRHETRVSSLGKTSKYNRYLLPWKSWIRNNDH